MCYIKAREFEWDAVKRAANLVRHGLDFADLAAIDGASAICKPVLGVNCGEDRFRAFVPWDGQLHREAFTRRGRAMRILRFRRASGKERRMYDPQ